jgi:hypothetical protein
MSGRCAPRRRTGTTTSSAYVADLGNVVDMEVIRGAKLRLGVDPLGGAGVHYWARIAERYGLNLTVVSEVGRPHVPLHDGGLGRPDPHGPSSPYAMQRLIGNEGPLRPLVRLRHRPRPARHRHQERRAAAAQPLPRVAISYLFQNGRSGQGGGGRQDGRQQRR